MCTVRDAAQTLHTTLQKMYTNILNAPAEAKFRKINKSNPNFAAKVYSAKGAPELFQLVGFKEGSAEQAGFLVLPDSADLALLTRALDALAAHAASRLEKEERKRKLEAEAASQARAARADKAREAAAPAEYDAAVSGAASSQAAQMADEDEVMIEAIGSWFEANPAAANGHDFDDYAIERQVAGPGGSVVASVAASEGVKYFDYLATMKRSDGGAWTVSKIVPAE